MGLEITVRDTLDYLIENPALLSICIATLIGLLYYFGSLINANNWQYNYQTKELHIYRGLDFMFIFVFIHIIIIYLINYFFGISSYLQKIPFWVYFILIFIMYFILLMLDNWISKKLYNFDNPIYANLGVLFANSTYLIFPFYLLNFAVLTTTNSSIWIIAMIVMDFFIISKFARLSNLNQQGSKAEIKLSNPDDIKIVRLIEFIERGTFLKVQVKDTKDVYAIPTSRIEYVKPIYEDNKAMLKDLLSIQEKRDSNGK